ncbi:TIGR03943 family protein, partial [Enterococcus faecalis]|uniref:TIGR03943 family putative permease subunit n=1 Tax=Enterococcus faecalis TaxID=1351 RepID=UPI003D76992E
PEHTQFQNNDWVTITGTVELSYFPPFKRQIPTVQVEKVKADQAPKNQFVYRSF